MGRHCFLFFSKCMRDLPSYNALLCNTISLSEGCFFAFSQGIPNIYFVCRTIICQFHLSSLDRKAAFSCSWPSFSLSQFYTPSNIAMHQPFPLLDLTSFMWRDARLHSPPCCRCSCLLLLPAPCKPLHPYTPLLTVSIWTTHVSTTPFWLFKLLKFGPALFGVPPTPFELPDYSYLEISCLDHLILDYL